MLLSSFFSNLLRISFIGKPSLQTSLASAIVLLLCCFPSSLLAEGRTSSASFSQAEPIGATRSAAFPISLWVEAEGTIQPFQTKAGFDSYLRFTEEYAFPEIFAQVYRGGRSWFPSNLADDSPYTDSQASGFDPIADSIRNLGQTVDVHAWVNTLRVYRNEKAPLVASVGEQAILKDSSGNSLLNYSADGNPPKQNANFKLGTHGLWLDPGVPAVRAYIVETYRELVRAYPELAGLHLDMVRYPLAMRQQSKLRGQREPGFGYSEQSLDRFYQLSRMTKPDSIGAREVKALERGQAWGSWRSAQVTLLVHQIREMLREEAPQMQLSAAVLANQERALNHAYQNWPLWLRQGLVDFVIPMNYTRRQRRFAELSDQSIEVSSGKNTRIGVGAWLLKDSPEELITQIRRSERAGATGVTLFSYANLADRKGRASLDYMRRKGVLPKVQTATVTTQ